MKNIDEITRLSEADLERIGSDAACPVPEELHAKTTETLSRLKRARTLRWSAAGVAAALVAIGIGLNLRPSEPKDTFTDPYLAYAEVERVFAKISDTVAYGADKLSETESRIDKISYWK